MTAVGRRQTSAESQSVCQFGKSRAGPFLVQSIAIQNHYAFQTYIQTPRAAIVLSSRLNRSSYVMMSIMFAYLRLIT